MDCPCKAEYYDMVAGAYAGITVYEHASSVAYERGYGHAVGQVEVFNGVAGYLAVGFCLYFGHLRIGKSQAFR